MLDVFLAETLFEKSLHIVAHLGVSADVEVGALVFYLLNERVFIFFEKILHIRLFAAVFG